MVDTGWQTPVGRITTHGTPRIIRHKKVETVTNMYPGKLVMPGTTAFDVVVHDGNTPPTGWLGYEHTHENARKDAYTTITVADELHSVISGGGFDIYGWQAAGNVALEGDDVFSWEDGNCVAGCLIRGIPAVRIAYTKNTSETDTSLDLPPKIIVHDAVCQSVVADASGTIEVGILSTEAGGDLDGFLDVEALAATGIVAHNMVDASAASITLGVLLDEVQIKDATGTPVYTPIVTNPGYVTDGTAQSVVYKTSNHTQSGYIFLMVSGPGIKRVGRCLVAATTTTAAARMWIASDL
jgi:hypothetical protein